MMKFKPHYFWGISAAQVNLSLSNKILNTNCKCDVFYCCRSKSDVISSECERFLRLYYSISITISYTFCTLMIKLLKLLFKECSLAFSKRKLYDLSLNLELDPKLSSLSVKV